MKKRNILIILVGLLVIIALVFQACQKEENNEDSTPPIYTNGKGEIGTIGGTVKIEDPQSPINGASIVIPKGALTSSVDFTIEQPDSNYYINGSNNHLLIEILPSGIQFNEAITIGIPYQSIENEEYFKALYYNPENGELEELESVELDKQNKIFYAKTGHTSIYFCDELGGGGGGDTFTDPRDGKTYNIVTIGTQTWFAENLNYQTDNSWCHGDNPANCNIYGRLYTWDDAIIACPDGWHLPDDEEWKILELYLGMSQSEVDDSDWRGTDEGGKLKETGTIHWDSPNTGATNSSGFTALPGGYRGSNSIYYYLGFAAYFWSSTDYLSNADWNRNLYYYYVQINRDLSYKEDALSCRCVKD